MKLSSKPPPIYREEPVPKKIPWGKLSADTPKFIIESDATIVAPLIFACVLGQ